MAPSPRPPTAPHPTAALVVTDAAAVQADPTGVIRGWARGLGCDGATVILVPRGSASASIQPILWSTWGDRWQRAYRAAGWFDVDPRVEVTLAHDRPCLWDGGTMVAEGRRARFLREAARIGIRSGLAIPVRNPYGRGVVAFDSSVAPTTAAGREAVLDRLGEAIWIAEILQANRCIGGPVGRSAGEGAPPDLSARERSCLALSARGYTSRDIAMQLGIATRTVDFHIGNVLAKLAAANRHEAIAKAAARGWLPH